MNQVKVGLIGTGKWGNNHLRVYSELQKQGKCELVGIADIDPSKKELADELGTWFTTDFKDLLKKVDAVSVVVPTTFHYDIVKYCLNAGKHVLVEKPITLKSEQAKELVDLAKEKSLLLSVGYLFRFNPSVIKLKEMIKNGEAGKIQYLHSRYIHSSKPPRADSGVIFNLGIHMIDILNFVLDSRPKRVYCKKVNFVDKKHEDSAVIVLDYGSFFAEVEVSCCHPLKKRDMWVIGENKKIYADFFEQRIVVHPLKIVDGEVIKEPEQEIEIHKNEPLKQELEHFVDSVGKHKEQIKKGIPSDDKNTKSIMNIGEEEYYTTKICELALQSAEFKRDLDLE